MKLIGAILIVSLVSVSSQESFNRAPLPYVHRARSHFIPLFYANGIPAGYDLIDTNKAQQVAARNNESPSSRLFNNLITFTQTTTSTVVSAIVTPVFVNCLPVAQFNSTSNTTACARRRRDVASILADDIQPAAVLPLEASVITDDQPVAPPQMELLSSKSDELPVDSSTNLEERRLTTTKVITSLVTSFTFKPTSITATATLAAAGGLFCLPAGYVVCK